ncbi:MAG: glycosyltransferase family 39 protein [Ignavibacteriales bacterium]|nr:glycosyltransferase family 39 protein [Ignavibacteriales bacterium]
MRHKIYLASICVIFFGIGLLRLNDLTIYTPDSSRYLIFANSLAHGNGFVDNTQPEPDMFSVQAPLYPIILIPSQLIFPFSLEAAKIWTLLWGILAIILFYRLILTFGNHGVALGASIMFAFNPLTFIYSTEVLSEAPFLSFLFISFIWLDKKIENKKNLIISVWSIAAVALLREIGVVLAVGAVISCLLQKEWRRAFIIAGAVVSLMGLWYLRNHYLIGDIPEGQSSNYSLLAQHFVTTPETPLINEIALRVWLNIKLYFYQLGGMVIYPLFIAHQFKLQLLSSGIYTGLVSFFAGAGKFLVLFVVIPFVARGIVLDFQSSTTALLKSIFLFLYLCTIFLYPVYDIRFLMPVLPLIIYYSCRTIIKYKNDYTYRKIFQNKYIITAVVVILLSPNFISAWEILKLNTTYRSSPVEFFKKYGKEEHCPIMFTQPWSMLGEWISRNLPDSVTIASPAKNLSTVIGNRKMIEIDQGVVQPVFETLLRDNNVGYILSPSRGQDLKIFHFLMLESKRLWFEKVYSVGNLYLYKIHSRFREPATSGAVLTYSSDSTTVNYLVEQGRADMLDGKYDEARSIFSRALEIDSLHPALIYQMIVCRSLACDSVDAMKHYNTLYKLPQSLGFIFQSRLHLQAMEQVLNTRIEKFELSRGVESFKTASLYWKLGYPRRAQEILDDYLKSDSTYFVGLLWGIHFNLQNGDTAHAKKYLATLKNIDQKNQVVSAFDTIFNLYDSLAMIESVTEKSELYFNIGEQYKRIELFEEAIDQFERAVYYDPRNEPAFLSLGQVFETKSKFRVANKVYRNALEINPTNFALQNHIDSLELKIKR